MQAAGRRPNPAAPRPGPTAPRGPASPHRHTHCFTFSPSASLRLFLAASSSLTYVAITGERGRGRTAHLPLSPPRRKASLSATAVVKGGGDRPSRVRPGGPVAPVAPRRRRGGAGSERSGAGVAAMPGLLLGDEAPNFEAETTQGRIRFHDFLGDS